MNWWKKATFSIFIARNRIMFGALFKSAFAYHFPSLKSNQFPFDKYTLSIAVAERQNWSNNWHISICAKYFSYLNVSQCRCLHNLGSNWQILVEVLDDDVTMCHSRQFWRDNLINHAIKLIAIPSKYLYKRIWLNLSSIELVRMI